MSDQIQVFWDPYLNALIFETPNTNPTSALPSPIVTPDEFQAPPSTVATFIRDPNAPLGSFHNPHPHLTSTDTGITPLSTAAPTASVFPQGSIQWQPDLSAPVGSYMNAHPYVPQTLASPPAAAFAPPLVPTQQQDDPVHQTAMPTQPTWEADVARMFAAMNHHNPGSEPPTQATQAADASATSEAPSTQAAVTEPTPPTTRRRHRATSRSRNSSRARRVRFADEMARIRANTEAAAQASRRAYENEMENKEYIDALTEVPPRHRRPTPVPAPGTAGLDARPETPQSRSSSTASTIDPMTAQGAPIPAAPSRNPGFRDPRRAAPARTGHSEVAVVGAYETWPLCTMCEHRPATIRKSGISFCDGCLGQALVAEERKGRNRGRR
ncbi:MAG: hypothetical protein Q9169_002167 [Polycauliona sp. 2 TL-2023]